MEIFEWIPEWGVYWTGYFRPKFVTFINYIHIPETTVYIANPLWVNQSSIHVSVSKFEYHHDVIIPLCVHVVFSFINMLGPVSI